MDAWLQPLLTNRSVIALNQGDRTSRPVDALPADLANAKVWISAPRGRAPDTVAIFNVSEAPLSARVPWRAIGLAGGRNAACDLWSKREIAAAEDARVTIAPHDVTLLQLGRCAKH
jgi:hypothetical protein